MRSLEEIVLTLCKFLNEHKIPYALIGGVTLSALGAPRTTHDVDLIVDLKENEIAALVKFLKKKKFIADEKELRIALRERSHFTIFDNLSPFRIDLKGIYSARDLNILKKRIAVKYKKVRIWMWCAEDAIGYKLLSGSKQDIKDAKSILARQYGKLDIAYLKNLCKRLGVERKLMKIKREVEKVLEKRS